jgi:hypothetical protein
MSCLSQVGVEGKEEAAMGRWKGEGETRKGYEYWGPGHGEGGKGERGKGKSVKKRRKGMGNCKQEGRTRRGKG